MKSHPFFRKPARHIWSATVGNVNFPPETCPEVALMGRSNVGKSSLINAILGQKVARSSNTPGATRGAHFYEIGEEGAREKTLRLVDLPGYGYAKMSKTEAAQVQELMAAYLENRRTLKAALLLIDVRHGLKSSDEKILAHMLELGLNVSVVATKIDKLHKKNLETAQDFIKAQLSQRAVLHTASAQKKEGIEDIQKKLLEIIP